MLRAGHLGAALLASGCAPARIMLDRPYLLVTNTTTGEPLFLARVANPTAR